VTTRRRLQTRRLRLRGTPPLKNNARRAYRTALRRWRFAFRRMERALSGMNFNTHAVGRALRDFAAATAGF
jgi:hypothetical protein